MASFMGRVEAPALNSYQAQRSNVGCFCSMQHRRLSAAGPQHSISARHLLLPAPPPHAYTRNTNHAGASSLSQLAFCHYPLGHSMVCNGTAASPAPAAHHRTRSSGSAYPPMHSLARHGTTRLPPRAYTAPVREAIPTTEPAPAASGPAAPSVLSVQQVSFHPPGVPAPLLDGINMEVPPNSLGLIIGRSGSGKTTLLQVLAGLCDQTSGTIHVGAASQSAGQGFNLKPSPSSQASTTASTSGSPGRGAKFAARMALENRPARPPLSVGRSSQPAVSVVTAAASMEERMSKVGLVFQFPERHFLGSDVFSELTFSWPRDPSFFMQQQALRARVVKVLQAVRLADVDMGMAPWSLSGGQQRRLALAIQLIRQPSVLLLDEPLAGLDWQARQEVVELLHQLKKQCSLLVVSHDLREVSPLVDCAWVMRPGGRMERMETWPPPGGLDQLNSVPARQLQ